jgi:hypothetical protein
MRHPAGSLASLAASAAAPQQALAASPGELAAALEPRVTGPPGQVVSPGTSMPWAPRQLYYPDWMFGEWQVASVFKQFYTPLGPK